MPIIVVGGSGRNVGKTSLVCGLIAALPELEWTAVKITSHVHNERDAVWEETAAGQNTDTARYLAAGARRAFLLTAPEIFTLGKPELAEVLDRFWPNLGRGTNLIFESNRILNHMRPDVCLLVLGGLDRASRKPSFFARIGSGDAMVVRANADAIVGDASGRDEHIKPIFHLVDLERISPEMLDWLRLRLNSPRLTS
jgi:hypothetical protein